LYIPFNSLGERGKGEIPLSNVPHLTNSPFLKAFNRGMGENITTITQPFKYAVRERVKFLP